ncbi:MAG TPA: hypothetical protein VL098_02145 [Flavipsychrobacter sp.]|nr:hypothetical protein [Flavipsychrobacter sp.]
MVNDKPAGISSWTKADIIGKIAIPVMIFVFGMGQTISNNKRIEQEKLLSKRTDSLNGEIAKRKDRLSTELQVLSIVWNDLNNSEQFAKTSDFVNNFLEDNNIDDSGSVLRRALAARSRVVIDNKSQTPENRIVAANVVANYEVARNLPQAIKVEKENAGASRPPEQMTVSTTPQVQTQLNRINAQTGIAIVYIQYATNACKNKVQEVRKYLEAKFVAPAPEWVKNNMARSEIRYFNDSDSTLAQELKAYCRQKYPQLDIAVKKAYTTKRVPKNQVELWMGTDYCN